MCEIENRLNLKETIEKAMNEIRDNHHKILDDWCKAHFAELYEQGIDINPSMCVLCESELHEEDGKLVRNYYVRFKRHFEKSGWFKKEDAPKDGTIFLAKKDKNYWVAKYYTKENPHPINGECGFTSVICDCCEDFLTSDFDEWRFLDE